MRDMVKLGGQAARATSETMPRHIWKHEVSMASVGLGVDPDFVRGRAVNAALDRAYREGEPVWMAADEVIQLWRGERLSKVGEASDRRVLRRAIRGIR